MGPAYVNQFGRKPSRGLRPWLLLPKVLCVAGYLGGLAAALTLYLASNLPSLGPADPRRLWTIHLLGRLFIYLIVPSLLGVLLFGLALLLQHPLIFLRMRWLQFKLIAVAILIPSAHLYLRSRLLLLRQSATDHLPNPTAERQFLTGLIITLAASIALVLLARFKPRLGQNWARTYAGIQTVHHEHPESAGSGEKEHSV